MNSDKIWFLCHLEWIDSMNWSSRNPMDSRKVIHLFHVASPKRLYLVVVAAAWEDLAADWR